MRRILAIHLPNWPVQRLCASLREGEAPAEPQPSQPLILHARDPRRGELVVAMNAAAHQCGVRVAMPLAEAAALASRAGKHYVLPHDPAADLAALARLAEHCERFSPLVGWETVGKESGRGQRTEDRGQRTHKPEAPAKQPARPADCLFLDVTGIGVLFGGEEALACEVIAELARLGYEARVAIAPTIGAAGALAEDRGQKTEDRGQESGVREQETEQGSVRTPYSVLSTQYPVLSTQYADRPKSPIPNPQSQICNLQSSIRNLPISALRLPQVTIDLLQQLGITRIDQLLTLPRASLRSRFGEQLLLRLDQLLGSAEETIVAHRPPPRFQAEWLLEFPTESRELLEEILRHLIGQVAAALAARREGVVQLACRLDCSPGRPVILSLGLFCPSADLRHLWDLLRMQLDDLRLSGPTSRLTLAAAVTAPLENRQGELFAGNQHEAGRQFALLVDRLSSRLGSQAVLRASPTADPLPEKAVSYLPAIQSASRHRKAAPRRPEKFHPLHRPLFMRQPQPLEAISVIPEGPPVSFRWQGKQHRIAHHVGPERIETGWWRGRSVRRDYYRVETTAGQRFWLFRRLEDGQWLMHGEFS